MTFRIAVSVVKSNLSTSLSTFSLKEKALSQKDTIVQKRQLSSLHLHLTCQETYISLRKQVLRSTYNKNINNNPMKIFNILSLFAISTPAVVNASSPKECQGAAVNLRIACGIDFFVSTVDEHQFCSQKCKDAYEPLKTMDEANLVKAGTFDMVGCTDDDGDEPCCLAYVESEDGGSVATTLKRYDQALVSVNCDDLISSSSEENSENDRQQVIVQANTEDSGAISTRLSVTMLLSLGISGATLSMF